MTIQIAAIIFIFLCVAFGWWEYRDSWDILLAIFGGIMMALATSFVLLIAAIVVSAAAGCL